MIRVVIVEDQSIIQEGLKLLIETDPDIEVVGFADNGRRAFEQCEKLSPDLVLMDIVMPEYDGIEGTRLIKEKYPLIKVLVLTTFNEVGKISKAFEYGADGYILKEIKKEELILAIKSVAKELRVVHKDAYSALVRPNQFQNVTIIEKSRLNVNLTEREIEIIRLIVDGKDNGEIAKTLCLSEGTTRNVISRILKKLELKDRIQLAVFAVKNDLV